MRSALTLPRRKPLKKEGALPSSVGNWKTLAAAVAGPRKEPSACEDHCEVRVLAIGDHDVLVAVCADGAGSASHGGEGARIACATLHDQVREALQPGRRSRSGVPSKHSIHKMFVRVAERLQVEARLLGVPVRELATTLLLAVVAPGAAAFAQVGDGVIVVRDLQGCRHVFWPARGEYANTTDFATDDVLALRCTTAGAVDELALMSDGLQVLALDYAAQAAHPPFFSGFFSEMHRVHAPETELSEPLRRFLGSPAVSQRTDDDVSLVLAVRVRQEGPV